MPSSVPVGLTDYAPMPTRDELRAHADNLRDMLADGINPMNLRLAANALEALARGMWTLADIDVGEAPFRGLPYNGCWIDGDVFGDGGGDPIGPPPLGTFEMDEPSRRSAAP